MEYLCTWFNEKVLCARIVLICRQQCCLCSFAVFAAPQMAASAAIVLLFWEHSNARTHTHQPLIWCNWLTSIEPKCVEHIQLLNRTVPFGSRKLISSAIRGSNVTWSSATITDLITEIHELLPAEKELELDMWNVSGARNAECTLWTRKQGSITHNYSVSRLEPEWNTARDCSNIFSGMLPMQDDERYAVQTCTAGCIARLGPPFQRYVSLARVTEVWAGRTMRALHS